MLLSFFTFVDNVAFLIDCWATDTCDSTDDIVGLDMVFAVGVSAFIAVLFLMFTLMIFTDQLNMIRKNTSTIDQKKGNNQENDHLISKLPRVPLETWRERRDQIMGRGGPCNFYWLLPINTQTPLCIEDELVFKII